MKTLKIVFPILLLFIIQKANAQPNANTFTWIKGANVADQTGFYGAAGNTLNTPGARSDAMSWKNNGILYLFGGSGIDGTGAFGKLNDLWAYDTNTNLWTYLKGPSTIDDTGDYGIKGVAAASNLPGARTQAVTWGANNRLYMYGGINVEGNNKTDLW